MAYANTQKVVSRLIASIGLLTCAQPVAAQCIDKEKITYGGDWGYQDYIHLCPTYQFAYGGTESKEWGVLADPVSMAQAPAIISQLKQSIEDSIRRYSGAKFYQQLHFQSVEMGRWSKAG